MFQGIQIRHYTREKVSLKINTQEKHRQYGLQHNETRKIHYPQEEKFIRMETEVSLGD